MAYQSNLLLVDQCLFLSVHQTTFCKSEPPSRVYQESPYGFIGLLGFMKALFHKLNLVFHAVAAKLVSRRDGFSVVVASAYGPSAPALKHELGEDLVRLRGAYPDSPLLIGGDFNVTLQANDRPNGGGGQDPRSRQLREVITLLGLVEMGPSDRRFTWRGPTTQSRLDRFLCSNELLAAYPLAQALTLPRPLLDHSPIMWDTQVGDVEPSYFKLNRSWLRDERLKGEIVQWWGSRIAFGLASDRLYTKLKDLRHHLFSRRR